MLKIAPPDHDTGFDPRPCFATDAEVALAQRLREELEARYFGRSVVNTLLPVQSDEVH